jgi:hypothetical protein
MEEDWNLVHGLVAVGRTRGSRSNGVPEVVDMGNENSSEGSQLTLDPAITADSLQEDEETAVVVAVKKPTHSRVILEVSQLQQAFERYPCPKCSEHLELKLRTVCIASSIELICNNKECTYQSSFNRPSPTTMHADDKYNSYERMTDYAANVLYVLGLISVGDGATEAGRMLGLLGLPNDTTMMNRSFGIIEERVSRFVRTLCDEIIKDNIDAEAKASMNEFDYNVWKMWEGDPTLCPMPVDRMPQLDATYDMAWQQKGSGHQYNSMSGHGSLFGRHTRKIIGLVIKSKPCSYCNTYKKKNPGAECWKNT